MDKAENRVEIRPITEADIMAFYGHGLRQTCRGWSIYLDDELAAICGITIGPKVMVAFSEIKPGLDVPDIMIWRTAKKLMELIKAQGFAIIFAIASPKIPGAPAFLARLGFEHIESSVRGEVFKWVIQ